MGNGNKRYVPKLVGTSVYLSPICVEDAPLYTAWLNDMEVLRYLELASQSISLESERGALESLAKRHNYAIILAAEDRLIGNVGLLDLDSLNRRCEIGIFIGDKSCWGKGYGSEALRLLLGYAFDYLNMRNIMLRVYGHNERAIASYKKIGFTEMGRRRSALRREGREYDVIYMDVLDEEFRRRWSTGD